MSGRGDPADPVVVFIASRGTHPTKRRVLWKVSRADAMAICSDPRTAGDRHMLCWTAEDVDDPQCMRYVRDNGVYAAVLAELGVRVLRAHPTVLIPIS